MPWFETPRARRRRQAYEAGFLDSWQQWIVDRVPGWRALSTDERSRLLAIALEIIVDTKWEAANDFVMTDEVKVTIAGQAAILLLELPADCVELVSHVIVRETEWIDESEPDIDTNIALRDPQHILGEVLDERSTLIVWDAVMEDPSDVDGAAGVVFHELAHKLDLLDGVSNGTPPIEDRELHERWINTCEEVFALVGAGHGPECLIDYAATDPGEFFAVTTEVFFCRPQLLAHQRRDLYDLFVEYYGQDPESRMRLLA